MEHPLLFLSLLFEAVGLGDFAHHYPHVVYSWLVILLFVVLARVATLSVRFIPGALQNFFEIVIEAIENFQVDVMGEEGRRYFPLIATIGLYIFVCNLLGLIPGMLPPTSSYNTTLSCAIVTFFATHYVGIKCHGLKYVKHFTGPIWPLAPLMVPIEIIGHLARVLSLSMRLFGNIMGHELVLGMLFFLAGMFFAPLPVMALGIFVSFMQAFIFALLSMMYIASAIHEAH